MPCLAPFRVPMVIIIHITHKLTVVVRTCAIYIELPDYSYAVIMRIVH